MGCAKIAETLRAAVLLCLIAGCAAPDIPPPPPPVRTPEIQRRDEAFRQVLSAAPRRWLVVSERALDLYRTHYPKLIERARGLGFEELVIHFTAQDSLDSAENAAQFTELVRALTQAKMPYRLMLRQGNFYRHGYFYWPFGKRTPPWVAMAEQLAGLVRSLPGDCARPAGMVAVPEPHRFTRISERKPGDLLFAWQEKCYGPGLDNDELLKQSLRETSQIREKFPDLPFTAGLAGFYHDFAVSGKLSTGRVTDLAKFGLPAMISVSGAKPSAQVGSLSAEFAAMAAQRGSVMVEILLSEHAYGSEQAFRRRGWNDLVKIMRYAMERWNRTPAFGGVVFNSFEALGSIQEP